MRTITTEQNEVLTRGKYKVEVRVEIEDSTATLVDVSSYEGQNWIRSVEISNDVDASVMTANIKLFARRYDLSMHPLDEASKINLPSGSYAPFLDVRRQVRVLTATVPQDYTAVTADFELLFDGFIDMIPESGKKQNEINLECRDKGAVLQDTWIEDLERYGDGTIDGTDNTIGGGLLEDILQDVFDNWVSGTTLFSANGTGGTPFNAGDSPGFVIEAWDVNVQSVMDAIRIGANSIGWECRYRFQDNQGEFEVQLYDPDRAKATVDRTFGPSDYIDVKSFDIDVSKIRNAIEVTYYTDPEDEQSIARLEVTDATSITRYGRRWMGIVEAQSSAINTSGEATLLANAILADLREPDRDQSIEMPFFWAAQLGDRYTFSANGVNYSTDQTWAVVGYRHLLTQGKQRTVIDTRRAPSGGVVHWWGKGQIPGLGGVTKDKVPTTPVLTLDTLDHGILVEWENTLMRAGKVSFYEVHISVAGAGFVPDATTLVAKTRSTRYRVNGIDQQTTYYVKIIAVDDEGNVGTASSAVSSTPGFLRGFPGEIQATLPDATTLLPGQKVLVGDVEWRRRDETLDEYIKNSANTLGGETPQIVWDLDEPSGATATDTSGNGNDGTYENTPASYSINPLVPDGGTAVQFVRGAPGDDVTISGLGLTSIDSFAISMWVNTDDASGNQCFFDARDAGGTIKLRALLVHVGRSIQLTVDGTTSTLTKYDFFDQMIGGTRLYTFTWDSATTLFAVWIGNQQIAGALIGGSALAIDRITVFADDTSTAGLGASCLGDKVVMWWETANTAIIDATFLEGYLKRSQVHDTRFESTKGDASADMPFAMQELRDDQVITSGAWRNVEFAEIAVDTHGGMQIHESGIDEARYIVQPGQDGWYMIEAETRTTGTITQDNWVVLAVNIDFNGSGSFPTNPVYWGQGTSSVSGSAHAHVSTPRIYLEAGAAIKIVAQTNDASVTLDADTSGAASLTWWEIKMESRLRNVGL